MLLRLQFLIKYEKYRREKLNSGRKSCTDDGGGSEGFNETERFVDEFFRSECLKKSKMFFRKIMNTKKPIETLNKAYGSGRKTIFSEYSMELCEGDHPFVLVQFRFRQHQCMMTDSTDNRGRDLHK